MRITAFIASVPLLAGALSAQTAANGRLPGEGGQGVTVKLLPPSPQTHEPLRYVLSEDAYVAAFVVYPGAGVRLLYPTVDVPERVHRAGYNTDQLIGVSFDNDIYRVVLGPMLSGPAYLYVITSRHPLDVARYVHRPMRLASAIGEREARSFYTDVAFDALLNNAVSLGDDTSWDSDVYMLWGNSESAASYADVTLSRRAYTTMLCSDGTMHQVPINYPFIGCPGQARIRPTARVAAQLQQSASAAATTAIPTQQKALTGETATVLPTIVGAHITDAQRRMAIQREAASQRVMYTTANGDQAVATPQTESISQTQLQAIDVRPERGAAENARRNRDAIRGQYSVEQREQGRQRELNGGNGGTAGAPQLSPNPRLSPNPSLAPAPGFSSNRAQSDAPRGERPQRDLGNEQHSAQREMRGSEMHGSGQSRMSQPQMSQPTPSAPAPAADNSAKERPAARIQQ